MGFPGGSVVKNPETRVPSLGREEPLEVEMETYNVILAGNSLGQRSLVGYGARSQSWIRLSTYAHVQGVSQVDSTHLYSAV